MITAVVPVKTHSERLANKNLRWFIDCSLYEHKLKQLLGVPFDRIIVSSEDKIVIQIARNYGFQGHTRDPKYSTSDIPMSEVYKYVASEIPGDDIAWVNVTNPLITGEMYTQAIELYKGYIYKRKRYDSLISVFKMQKYIWYNKTPVNWTPYPHPKSQDLEGTFAMSFAVNMCPKKDLIKYGNFVRERTYFYILDRYISTKIDYKEDLDFCRMLWKQKKSS